MTLQTRFDSLKERHAALETRIADEDQRPKPDSETLTRVVVSDVEVLTAGTRYDQQKSRDGQPIPDGVIRDAEEGQGTW